MKALRAKGEGFPPEGWTLIDGYPNYGWKKGAKFQHNCAKIQEVSGTENWLITPQLKPEAGENLKFSACIGDYAASGELRIEISLAGTDAASFELLDTYYTSKTKGDEAHRLWKSEWKEYTIDLSAYKGSAIYVGFHQTGGTDGIFLDDVKGVSLYVETNCENPTNLVLSNLDAHEATFSWKGNAAEYQYLLLEDGEEVDWEDATKVAAKTVTVSNLYEETNYVFYVRSYCSESEQSLAPKIAFKTPCESFDIPWLETFTRDQTGSGWTTVEPDCWTLATQGSISVVKDATYNEEEGTTSTVNGQAHLQVTGGGPNSPQVFAMPTFKAPLNTLEVAFDYRTSLTTDGCGILEVGYMTNPNKAETFVSLQSLTKTVTYVHKVITLEDLPESAKFIAFRFAGGTSDYCNVAMDNFIVAEIGKSGEVDPSQEDIPDAGIEALTYCEASFSWYSYNNSAFAIGLFNTTKQALVAGITVTTEECDRFAYEDEQNGTFKGFSEDDDYENHYYCSTKWILNVEEDGMQRGEAWESSVKNIGTALSPILGLNPGDYQVQIYALVESTETESGYAKGEQLASIPFTIVSKEVANLAVAVAEDKASATLTWDAPEYAQGERLYVRVWAGETIAYDNFNSKERPTSPLVVSVMEGKTYSVIAQVIDKNNNPMGDEVTASFTVGVNNYEPKNPHAEVFGGDNVTFSWEVTTLAHRYVITLFWNGEFFATLTVNGTSKTTTMPKNGTWTWTVQAFNEGENGNYFEASNAIEGNAFESQATDVPEDAIELTVWAIEAAFMDSASGYDANGRHAWYISLATGEEDGDGLPSPIFMVYTEKKYAISGVYNTSRGNIDLINCGMDMTGKQADAVDADDAELRLQFDGFDEDKFAQGYAYGYYTGSFRIVAKNGKTYVGKFMEQFCNSFNFSSYGAVYRDHVGMWDEDPQGIENIQVPEDGTHKILHDGQIYIIRDSVIYTIQGMRVR